MSSPHYERSILITGGTAGLGYQCALQIARKHPEYQIVIASRSDRDASAESINQTLKQHNVIFLSLDLASLDNTRAFAKEWATKAFAPIQSFVMNAALQFPGEVKYTKDGYEKTFAIAHLGHALLFSLLRPHLADTARVVVTASGVHDPAQKTGLPHALYTTAEDLAHPPPESAKRVGRARYVDAKLANILYTYAMSRRFKTINKAQGKHWTVTAIDPGLMPGTGLAREGSAFVRFLWLHILPRIIPLFQLVVPNTHTAEESGAALARLAVHSDVEGVNGKYYEGLKEIASSKDSYDEAKQEDLWDWTVRTLARDDKEKAAFSLQDVA